MSRLEFAPKIDDIKVTDIKHGLGTFTPRPGTIVSFAKLREALKKAGYTLGSAEIVVSGSQKMKPVGSLLPQNTALCLRAQILPTF